MDLTREQPRGCELTERCLVQQNNQHLKIRLGGVPDRTMHEMREEVAAKASRAICR